MNEINVKGLKNTDVILVFITIIFLYVLISCKDTIPPKYEEYHCKSGCCYMYVEDNGNKYTINWVDNNSDNIKIEYVKKYADEDDSWSAQEEGQGMDIMHLEDTVYAFEQNCQGNGYGFIDMEKYVYE